MPNTSVTADFGVGCCFLVKRNLLMQDLEGDLAWLRDTLSSFTLVCGSLPLVSGKDDLKCTTNFAG